MKRGGSLSFLVRTISNILVMEIGWTDVGSGGYILVSCAHSNTSSGFWFIQDSGLFRVLVYSGFWFIQDSGLFWFIQGSGLYRILVYKISLYRILVYSGFWFIQDSGLFRVLVDSWF